VNPTKAAPIGRYAEGAILSFISPGKYVKGSI